MVNLRARYSHGLRYSVLSLSEMPRQTKHVGQEKDGHFMALSRRDQNKAPGAQALHLPMAIAIFFFFFVSRRRGKRAAHHLNHR